MCFARRSVASRVSHRVSHQVYLYRGFCGTRKVMLQLWLQARTTVPGTVGTVGTYRSTYGTKYLRLRTKNEAIEMM